MNKIFYTITSLITFGVCSKNWSQKFLSDAEQATKTVRAASVLTSDKKGFQSIAKIW